jgi:hypothetical protein
MFYYKKKQQANIYIIAPATSIIFGITCLFIIVGNIIVCITTKQIQNILYIAMCIPIANNIIIESILLVSNKSILIKGIIINTNEIIELKYKKAFILNLLNMLLISRGNNKSINIFISKKHKFLIQNVVNKRPEGFRTNNN